LLSTGWGASRSRWCSVTWRTSSLCSSTPNGHWRRDALPCRRASAETCERVDEGKREEGAVWFVVHACLRVCWVCVCVLGVWVCVCEGGCEKAMNSCHYQPPPTTTTAITTYLPVALLLSPTDLTCADRVLALAPRMPGGCGTYVCQSVCCGCSGGGGAVVVMVVVVVVAVAAVVVMVVVVVVAEIVKLMNNWVSDTGAQMKQRCWHRHSVSCVLATKKKH
jgi:hypothetical protein